MDISKIVLLVFVSICSWLGGYGVGRMDGFDKGIRKAQEIFKNGG